MCPRPRAVCARSILTAALEGRCCPGVGARGPGNALKPLWLGTPSSPNADSQPRSPVCPWGQPLEGLCSLALPCGTLASHPVRHSVPTTVSSPEGLGGPICVHPGTGGPGGAQEV